MAVACDELSACRKSIRRVLLQVCGGHSAYRDAKATHSLQTALKVKSLSRSYLLPSVCAGHCSPGRTLSTGINAAMSCSAGQVEHAAITGSGMFCMGQSDGLHKEKRKSCPVNCPPPPPPLPPSLGACHFQEWFCLPYGGQSFTLSCILLTSLVPGLDQKLADYEAKLMILTCWHCCRMRRRPQRAWQAALFRGLSDVNCVAA